MDIFKQKTIKVLKNISKSLKKEKNILLLIFILGFTLRLLGLINITLSGDNLLHWKIAGDIVTGHIFPLLGPRASITGDFNLGPFYYYLLAIPYWLGRGDFRMAIIFFALLNSFSIPLLYLVAKRWFSKNQSLLISLLFACSAYFIQIQSFPWNPYVLPLFIILSLYFVNKIAEKKYINIVYFAIFYALCLQLHATAIFLLPGFLYLMNFRRIPLKFYLLGIGAIIGVNLPWIYVNLTTNFSQIHAALLILTQGNTTTCSLSSWLLNHGNGEKCFWYFRNTLFAFRFINTSLFDINNIFFSILSLIVIGLYFINTKFRQNRYLLIWLFTPILFFLLYSNNIYLHYFLILTPIPFLLLVTFLEMLKQKRRKLAWVINVLYISMIVLNLGQYIWSLQFISG